MDEPVRIGQLCRPDTFLIGGVQLAIADIIHDRSGKEVGILQHHAKRPPQVRLFDLVDIDAVVADLAVRDIVEPVDQVRDRRLACARRTDKGDLLPRLRIQSNVMQHDLVLVISEIYIIENHAAFLSLVGHRAFRPVRMPPCPLVRADRRFCQISVLVLFRMDKFHIPLIFLRLFIHQIEYTLGAGRRIDDKVNLLADLGDRVRKALIQSNKSNNRTDGHTRQTVDPQDRADNGHQRIADPADIGVDRHKQVGIAVRHVRTVSQPFINLMEIPHGRLFMAENFDDFLAIQHLFYKTVHCPQIHLLMDVIFRRQL